MARRGGTSSRVLLGVASSQRRVSGIALWLARLREQGLRDGFIGGSRAWMAIGVVTWTMRIVYIAAHYRPQVVYVARLKKGESITIVEHPPGWRP